MYKKLLPLYFPRSEAEEQSSLPLIPADIGNAEGEPVVLERRIRISEKPGSLEGEFGQMTLLTPELHCCYFVVPKDIFPLISLLLTLIILKGHCGPSFQQKTMFSSQSIFPEIQILTSDTFPVSGSVVR